MGADLYISSIYDKKREELKPAMDRLDEQIKAEPAEQKKHARREELMALYAELETCGGYFRDSYNPTSLFLAIGLSWWRDVVPMCDEEGNLQPEQTRKLLHMIQDDSRLIPEEPEKLKAFLLEKGVLLDDGENSPEEWLTYFNEKSDRLQAFLRKAYELQEPIRCSL